MSTPTTEINLSVILPCRNGERFLGGQLESLVAQRGAGRWELIVVDNGSVDGSAAVAASFADRLPLTVVSAPEMANVSYARNMGVRTARAPRLAFIDADDRLGPDWVRSMNEALAGHALVAAAQQPDGSTSTRSATAATEAALPTWMPPASHAFLPYAQGSGLGVQRRWFDTVEGFDVDLGQLMAEDVAFSWQVQLAGGDFAWAPDAVVHYRSRRDLRAAMRQQFRVGRGQVVLYQRFRDRGMSRAGTFEVLSRWIALLLSLPAVPFSARIRGRWTGTFARRIGRVVESFRQRILYL